jgi:hypothetical protein
METGGRSVTVESVQRRVTLPVSLIVGVVFGVAGSAAFSLAIVAMQQPRGDDFERSMATMIRWQMFSHGATIVSLLLVASALFAVANRVSGYARTLLLIAAWMHAGWLGWIVGRPLLFELVKDSEKLEWLATTGWRVLNAVFWSATVLITIAARAWWRPANALVVIAAVAAVLLESISWAPYLGAAILELREDHRYLYQLIWPLREALSAGALLILVWGIVRDAPEPLPDPRAARSWLRGAEATLIVRVVAAILLAVLSVGLIRSPATLKLVVIALPTIAVIAVLAFSWTLLGVERAALVGMPKVRLVLGAALTAWAAGVQLMQVMAAFKGDGDSFGWRESEITSWSIIGPLVGNTGMILACSAIAKFALTRGNEALRETAIARGVIYAILSGIILGMPYLMKSATSKGTVIGMGLIIAICAIASLILVARLFGRAAETIDAPPTLPEARLRR